MSTQSQYPIWRLTVPEHLYISKFIEASVLGSLVLCYWLGMGAFFITTIFVHYLLCRCPFYRWVISRDYHLYAYHQGNFKKVMIKQSFCLGPLIWIRHEEGTNSFWRWNYQADEWRLLRIVAEFAMYDAQKRKEEIGVWDI
ncbi:hypothetical protein [Basilea psittacipulmonis]|uniref:Uncharacterized protein n=1 Tax=Basilea psittacipulmonis DSM 24701 TaxID=1072685 RepID=A0A077DGI5_9BURK|nr:hypothetical protein [Basilea psittacipulmonis]AIL33246.1 hypothetical protein IX83_08010 [Basilea psittacipulmonis DSM 24701]